MHSIEPSISQQRLLDDPDDKPLDLELTDQSRVRVVYCEFLSSANFSWDLFRGFKTCRVLTYNVDLKPVIGLFADFGFSDVECIIGSVHTVNRGTAQYLAVQNDILDKLDVAVSDSAKSAPELLSALASGHLRFRIVKDVFSHAKIYLLEEDSALNPNRRVIVGSANFSPRALSGVQYESLQVFDNDERAWREYDQIYRDVREHSSTEYDPAQINNPDRTPADIAALTNGPVRVTLTDDPQALAIRASFVDVERETIELEKQFPKLPKPKSNFIDLSPRHLTVIRQRPRAASSPPSFGINVHAKTATFRNRPFSLDYDLEHAATDANGWSSISPVSTIFPARLMKNLIFNADISRCGLGSTFLRSFASSARMLRTTTAT